MPNKRITITFDLPREATGYDYERVLAALAFRFPRDFSFSVFPDADVQPVCDGQTVIGSLRIVDVPPTPETPDAFLNESGPSMHMLCNHPLHFRGYTKPCLKLKGHAGLHGTARVGKTN